MFIRRVSTISQAIEALRMNQLNAEDHRGYCGMLQRCKKRVKPHDANKAILSAWVDKIPVSDSFEGR